MGGRGDGSPPAPSGPVGESRAGWIRVSRTARYQVLGDPARASEVWFVLHGYGQLAGRFIGRFARLPGVRDGARAVVAPEALSRFYIDAGEGEGEGEGEHGPASRVGATWMTREDREHEIRDTVEYLDRLAGALLEPPPSEPPRDPARGGDAAGLLPPEGRSVRVLGFSQGAAAASRWVSLGRIRPAELILWAGGLAHDLPESAAAALRGSRIRFVVGADDAWAGERSRVGMEWLSGRGLAAEVTRYPGGHRVIPAVLEASWPR